MKNMSTKWWIIGIVIVIIGLFAWSKSLENGDPDIISRTGFHWHPVLSIYVKGEKQELPANMGLGAVHQPIHTHDDAKDGVVHLEFQGIVRKQDIALGQFFKGWGKDINSFGTNIKMIVNGKENTDLENYQMQDKDEIELRYD